MGSSNFFSKVASADPLAQALDLPGAHKYAQAQAQDVQTNAGPYAGVTPTLAAANAGYVPGGPGAAQGWTPNQAQSGGGLFGLLQKGANLSGNVSAPAGAAFFGGAKSPLPTPTAGTSNPYVSAARGAASNPSVYGGG